MCCTCDDSLINYRNVSALLMKRVNVLPQAASICFLHQRLKHQNNHFLFEFMGDLFFSFSFSDCFLYIRVYDCFSVWSQNLKYESVGNY